MDKLEAGKLPEKVLGWHTCDECLTLRNGDKRQIEIGKTLHVVDKKKKIEVNNWGFHCSSLEDASGRGGRYLQRVELSGVGDRDNNGHGCGHDKGDIYAGEARTCLGIIDHRAFRRQYIAKQWLAILDWARRVYPEAPALDESVSALKKIAETGERDKDVCANAKKSLSGVSYGRSDNNRRDCGFMMMSPWGPAGWGIMGPEMMFHHSMGHVMGLGVEFMQSILEDRVDALATEVREKIKDFDKNEKIADLKRRAKILANALAECNKGLYPQQIIFALKTFLDGDSDEFSYISGVVQVAETMEPGKIYMLNGFSRDDDNKDAEKRLWAGFEEACLAGCDLSLKENRIVKFLPATLPTDITQPKENFAIMGV